MCDIFTCRFQFWGNKNVLVRSSILCFVIFSLEMPAVANIVQPIIEMALAKFTRRGSAKKQSTEKDSIADGRMEKEVIKRLKLGLTDGQFSSGCRKHSGWVRKPYFSTQIWVTGSALISLMQVLESVLLSFLLRPKIWFLGLGQLLYLDILNTDNFLKFFHIINKIDKNLFVFRSKNPNQKQPKKNSLKKQKTKNSKKKKSLQKFSRKFSCHWI